MLTTPSRMVVLLMSALVLCGCGQNPPAKKAGDSTTTQSTAKSSDAASKDKKADTPVLTPTPAVTDTKSTTPAVVASTSNGDGAFLGDDIIGIDVIHPQRLAEWSMYRMAKDAGLMEGDSRFLKPEDVERATVIIDQTTIDVVASRAGLKTETKPNPEVAGRRVATNNLKQLGLAFHNYHDSMRRFPRADGDGDGQHVGLSWRVHLLPYLEEAALYQQFHLDEPWDSEHNKTLIEKMPATYKTVGVTESGKTAFHVFQGKGAAFDGDKGMSIGEFTDGTSNTILAVRAGNETAEVWTKPGGLKFDAEKPRESLGKVDKFLVLMCDGTVRAMDSTVPDAQLALLIQRNDGQVVGDFGSAPSRELPPLPTVILTLVNPADRDAIVKLMVPHAAEESFEGQKFHQNEEVAVWFADDKTIVVGAVESVKKRITTKTSGKAGAQRLIAQLTPSADLSFTIDVESQAMLVKQAVAMGPPFPGIGLAQQLKSITLQSNVTGKSGGKLVEIVATFADETSATTLADLMQGLLEQGKQIASTLDSLPVETDDEKTAVAMAMDSVQSASIQQAGTKVEFLVTIPAGFENLPKLVKPAVMKAKAAADGVKKFNTLKMIALAFQNYNDVNRTFPGAGRSAAGKSGLSWRVHLLPYLDQGALYQQFNLEEPWDSEHNKALIEKMPEIYKTSGVTEAGKSSLHVFTGAGAPFADDKAPGLASITDGTSNTILAVEAGPDTAAIWTQPGGLDFDPKDPIKALGKLSEEVFRVVMCDGAARSLPKAIKADTLRKLIQSADGEPVDF